MTNEEDRQAIINEASGDNYFFALTLGPEYSAYRTYEAATSSKLDIVPPSEIYELMLDPEKANKTNFYLIYDDYYD